MEVVGIYFDVVQATQTPRGPFGLSVFVWGAILFTIASVSIIAQLWWHIYRTENRVNSVIKELRLFKVTIGDKSWSAVTILQDIWKELSLGMPKNELTGIIGKKLGLINPGIELFDAIDSLMAQLQLYGVVQIQLITKQYLRGSEIIHYCKLTDSSKEIIQSLRVKKKRA